ncbi:MAG: hypothetical protein A2W22_06100 [Candidatus Levybacteria bacterium RBG_16_35_11]|nr:MAG: hypothetical protein A2W22_06100 [Candidatus Levybacteria bacterium RBG_16_35_11]
MATRDFNSYGGEGSAIFNSAQFIIQRLNIYINLAQSSAVRDNYVKWFKYLRRAYAEVRVWFTDEEMKKMNQNLKEINELLTKHIFLSRRAGYRPSPQLALKLDEVDFMIRKVAQEKSMWMPIKREKGDIIQA